MPSPQDKDTAVLLAVKQAVESSGWVFKLTSKVASDLRYTGDAMELMLTGVRDTLAPEFVYAYKPGDGLAQVNADNTLSAVIIFVSGKTTAAPPGH